jgi:hypothetical protein
MKIIVKLYRVTTIRTAELLAAAGEDPESEMTGTELSQLVKDNFGPLHPTLQIFYPADTSFRKTVVGMEAMLFDLQDVNIPQSGLIMVDPISPQDVDRIDGAVEAELNRMGISTDFECFEWRMVYQIIGN